MTHHGILKRTGENSKVRVVFNPTERDAQGYSLNDYLLAGPKLQQDISVIITRFRLRPIALACDICQMFRCILVHPEDRKYFHMFWRSSPNEPIREWEHTRVIFGATSSPFLANRTIKQLTYDEGKNYPKATLALTQQTFVDDILTGAFNKSEAFEIKRQLIGLLKAGGFELGKWASSDVDVTQPLQDSVELPMGIIQSAVKVLGIYWDTTSDVFQYKVHEVNEPATKRGILSRVARTYDINGYLSPFTFLLKCLVQALWLQKIGWDEPLPTDILEKWLLVKAQLPLIDSITIPRCIYKTEVSCARTFEQTREHSRTLGFTIQANRIAFQFSSNSEQPLKLMQEMKVGQAEINVVATKVEAAESKIEAGQEEERRMIQDEIQSVQEKIRMVENEMKAKYDELR
ncbi:uncharacterized protein LOC116174498 [Photinus pyralis]|uniref:uncharacterized protein LOC116174498 n=1 Tax=Photinus pyralis TaxID=7054 RepID=UPI00126736D4|nr:uncharacterized protein LOC116174498 [Photinus pyralis]